MNMILKRILYTVAAIVGVVILLSIGYMIKAKSEINKMTPLDTGPVVAGITVIRDDYVNMYLIKDGDQYLAIDVGNDIDVISQELSDLGIDPDQVVAVLLTHSDFDHAAAIDLFKNATVYLSQQEDQMITGVTSRFACVSNSISAEAYLLLEDQEVLNIGSTRIQGILTPGHTPGSMCYLIDDAYLFTGDAVSLMNGEMGRFNEFFNMDTEMAVRSMEKLTGLSGTKYILTAHHGYSPLE